MKSFFKVFFVLVMFAISFSLGRKYGEKIQENSVVGSNLNQILIQLKEENNKLLIENKTLKLETESCQSNKKEEDTKAQSSNEPNKHTFLDEKRTSSAVIELKDKVIKITKLAEEKFTNTEWLLKQKSEAQQEIENAQKYLNELSIINFKALENNNSPQEKANEFLKNTRQKEFRGKFVDNDLNSFGSVILNFKNNILKLTHIQRGKEQVSFEVVNYDKKINASEKYSFVFLKSDQKYLQLYSFQNGTIIAGRLYEVLPNGTTKPIGLFILKSQI